MFRTLLIPAVAIAPFALTVACGGGDKPGLDNNHDRLADDLGVFIDVDGVKGGDSIDINHDGKPDGPAVDINGDGKADGLALDTNCDGLYDSVDLNGDGLPDLQTSRENVVVKKDCDFVNPVTGVHSIPGAGGSTGAGGSPGTGGTPGTGAGGSSAHGGSPGTAGTPGTAGSSSTGSQLGKGTYSGAGMISGSGKDVQYREADVYRNNVGYKFIANGWGANWQDHAITWFGTSFTVNSLNGSQGTNYSPAGYPTMFCGLYSMKQSDDCGLPVTITAAKSIKTGWRWASNGSGGQYNAAWDIWLGNNGTLSSYLMVWLRDPPGQQPAGSASLAGVTIPNVPGTWNIWKGSVNGLPIVNYVQPEGKDLSELEFDVLDLYKDSMTRNFNLPGSQILAVAVGYEIWNGPVANLATADFYVDVK
ncbi:MAG TPA: hypothetical protein VER96_15930 [Polyangiaceae bacterium]|nr:hypothetical protein [Polyangiaceae bacterium]